MSKFKTVYIHIGLHKTGSTTFQQYLYANRDLLEAEYGLYYPALSANLSQPIYGAFCEEPLAYSQNILKDIDHPEAARAHADRVRQSLSAEFEASSAAKAVISGEDLSLFSTAEWQDFLAWLTPWTQAVEILCVVREPLSWSRSAAQSGIKGGQSLEATNDNPPLPGFRRKLGHVIDVVGRDAIHVFDFDQLRHSNKGLVGGLCQPLGISDEWIKDSASGSRNTAMSQEAALIISALNQARPLVSEGKLGAERHDGDTLDIISDTAGKKFRLSAEAEMRVLDDSREDSDWLREHFQIEFSRSPEPDSDTGLFGEAFMTSIASQLLDKARKKRNNAALTNQVHEMRERNDTLRKDIEARETRNQGLLGRIHEKEDEISQHRQINEELRQTNKELQQEWKLEVSRLEEKLSAMEKENQGLRDDRANLLQETETLKTDLSQILTSTSWRITAPLRWLKDKLTGSS